MNKLKAEKKKQILQLLTEGCSVRSSSRIACVLPETILNVLVDVGTRVKDFMNDKIKDFRCKYIQADEIWTFVWKKDKQLTIEEKKDHKIGSQYIYVAMDAESKFVPTFIVGKRTKENTFIFIEELKKRLHKGGKIQLTTDGYKPYTDAVQKIFGDIDFAQTIKHQGAKDDEGKYVITITEPIIVSGAPEKQKISTSHIERLNLTIRMSSRRLTRKTNGFSKKLENLEYAIALHFFYYNFVRIHGTLGTTPSIAAGICDVIMNWDLFI